MNSRTKPFAQPPGCEAYEPTAKAFPAELVFAAPDTLNQSGSWFRRGLNLTVRRGDKWHGKRGSIMLTDVDGDVVEQGFVEETMLIRFLDIKAQWLGFQHDPSCRDLPGLYDRLKVVYPDFNAAEGVTCVFFRVVPPNKNEEVFR